MNRLECPITWPIWVIRNALYCERVTISPLRIMKRILKTGPEADTQLSNWIPVSDVLLSKWDALLRCPFPGTLPMGFPHFNNPFQFSICKWGFSLYTEFRHFIQMNYTRTATFSTVTFISCVSKLSKGHRATELLCTCSVPCEGTLAHMNKKRWLSLRQLVRLLCPSVPLTLPELIFELFTNQLLNHWSYLALQGWGKQLEVITTFTVSSWQ